MFIVTAILFVPALLALRMISAREINVERSHGGVSKPAARNTILFRDLLRQRSLMILGCCLALFHLANAAMLPLMGSVLTTRSSQWATALIAACIGTAAHCRCDHAMGGNPISGSRRPLLLLGFAALPIRGLLFATVSGPYLLVAVQLLDGLTAAVLGVLVPLMVADLTRGSGRYPTGAKDRPPLRIGD